jgi:hypothetical protein
MVPRKSTRLVPAAAAALALGALPGCAAIALGAGTLVAHQAFIADDSYEVLFKADADRAFAIARNVVEDLDPAARVSPENRRIEGRFDGASLEIEVDHESRGYSRLVVEARRYQLAAQGTAKRVAERIARRVNEGGPG